MGALSGRFVVRVTPRLHGALRDRAARLGVSLNEVCRGALAAAVDAEAGGATTESALPEHGMLARITDSYRPDIVGVILFGSRAQGTAGPHSDWDILLVMTPTTTLSRDLYRTWDELIDRADRVPIVNPHFIHLPPPAGGGSLWLEAALHGQVLWQRDAGLTRRLASARERIAAGEVRRRIAYGTPYWVHGEPDVQP
jgi:predicted nucleotidyltransferase